MKLDFIKVVSLLRETIPGLKGVYLFGSRADGTATADSDYDFAFLSVHHQLSDYELFRLRLQLSDLLKTDVDLIDLHKASTVLQFQVVSKGKRIFSSDNLFCDRFDLFVFSSYQRLNEERREIIEDIQQRGAVYAG